MNIESHQMFNTIDRKAAIITALPLFLFGLLISGIFIFLIIIGGPDQVQNIARVSVWHNSAIIVGALSLIILIYTAILGIKNNLAIWSYTWISAFIVGLIVSLNLVLDDRIFMFSIVVDNSIIILSLLSCIVIFCNIVLKGWLHTGLISIGFCGILGLSLLFFQVHKLSLLLCIASSLLGLFYAILVFLFLSKNSNTIRILIIISLACSNIVISWIVEATNRIHHSSRDINQFWSLVAFLTGFLLIGTLSGIPGQFIQKKFNLLKK